MGVPFLYPVGVDYSAPLGPFGGAYAIRPYMYPAKLRRRPQTPPYPGTRPFMYPAKLRRWPQPPLSALLSGSIFAAVFGDAKSDGPVRDVKRESSERLEQCPLL